MERNERLEDTSTAPAPNVSERGERGAGDGSYLGGLFFEGSNNGRLLRFRIPQCKYGVEMELDILMSGK